MNKSASAPSEPPPDYGFTVPHEPSSGSQEQHSGAYPGPPPYVYASEQHGGPTPYFIQPPAVQTVITMEPQAGMVHDFSALTSSKQKLTCPSCHETITTKTTSQISKRTHRCALFLCSSIICIPFCWVSYIFCTDTKHTCPKCEHLIGTYP